MTIYFYFSFNFICHDRLSPPNQLPSNVLILDLKLKNFCFSCLAESHLSKLLAHDAKRGAFRKYDGGVSPISPRSPEEQRRAATTDNVPRRLGGGRYVHDFVVRCNTFTWKTWNILLSNTFWQCFDQ